VTLTFDLESSVQVTCDVGYLCANFSLPRPPCSRLRPDVRDRQTDVKQHHRLMPPPRGRDIIMYDLYLSMFISVAYSVVDMFVLCNVCY